MTVFTLAHFDIGESLWYMVRLVHESASAATASLLLNPPAGGVLE
jgi:hypothetical protein